jgi:hypothetical protein
MSQSECGVGDVTLYLGRANHGSLTIRKATLNYNARLGKEVHFIVDSI